MLGCWASAGDLASAGACKESAKKLHECMLKPVRPPLPPQVPSNGFSRAQQPKGKPRVSSINYHLSRL